MAAKNVDLAKKHHAKTSFAYDRPKYREARWERAVKVYTVNLESKYLLVQGIPAVNATTELLELFALYGAIDEYRILDDYPAEEFTKVYWIKFQKIQSARFAKKKLDNRSFFGGILHVSYAAEFETVDDTREKLRERRRVIARKTRELFGEESKANSLPGSEGSSSSSVKCTAGQPPVPLASMAESFRPPLGMNSVQSGADVARSTGEAAGQLTWTLPTLPLPPQVLHPYNYPPPPPAHEFPRVPSAHATLPPHLQHLPPPPPPPSSSGSSPTHLTAESPGTRDLRQLKRAATPSVAFPSRAMVSEPTYQAVGPVLPTDWSETSLSPKENAPTRHAKPCQMEPASLDSTAASVEKKMRMVTSAPDIMMRPNQMNPTAGEEIPPPAPARVTAPKTKRRKRI